MMRGGAHGRTESRVTRALGRQLNQKLETGCLGRKVGGAGPPHHHRLQARRENPARLTELQFLPTKMDFPLIPTSP